MKNSTRQIMLELLDNQKWACSTFPMGSHARNIQETYYRGHFAMAEELLTDGFENDIVLRYNELTQRHEIIENGEVYTYDNE